MEYDKPATDVTKAVDSMAATFEKWSSEKKEYRINLDDLLDNINEKVCIHCDADCAITRSHLKPFKNAWNVDNDNVHQDRIFLQFLTSSTGNNHPNTYLITHTGHMCINLLG